MPRSIFRSPGFDGGKEGTDLVERILSDGVLTPRRMGIGPSIVAGRRWIEGDTVSSLEKPNPTPSMPGKTTSKDPQRTVPLNRRFVKDARRSSSGQESTVRGVDRERFLSKLPFETAADRKNVPFRFGFVEGGLFPHFLRESSFSVSSGLLVRESIPSRGSDPWCPFLSPWHDFLGGAGPSFHCSWSDDDTRRSASATRLLRPTRPARHARTKLLVLPHVRRTWTEPRRRRERTTRKNSGAHLVSTEREIVAWTKHNRRTQTRKTWREGRIEANRRSVHEERVQDAAKRASLGRLSDEAKNHFNSSIVK